MPMIRFLLNEKSKKKRFLRALRLRRVCVGFPTASKNEVIR